MDQRLLNIHDLTIAIQESSGQELPTLFFLHGNSQDASAFSLQINGDLGQKFHCVGMDLPGHGASSHANNPDAVYSVRGYVAVIQQVLRLFDPQATLLIGHSLGGHLLIQAAAEFPDLFGLMIFGTPPLQSPPRFDLAFLPHVTTPLIFQEHLTDFDIEQWSQAQGLRPEATRVMAKSIRRTDPKCRSSLAKSISQGEMQDECAILRDLSCPVAILLGEQDCFVNRDYVDQLTLPNLWGGCTHILWGTGHSPQLDAPKIFNAFLIAFIEHCLARK